MSEIRAIRGFSIPELNKRALLNTKKEDYYELPEQEYGFRVLDSEEILGPEVHENLTQFSGVVQGELTLTIRDGETREYKEGQIFKIPPNMEHIIVALKPVKMWSVYV